jgi:hypothetical protein
MQQNQHATFQQLAGMLVSAVKELQAVAAKRTTMTDKELEAKIGVVVNVSQLGF